MNNPVSHTGPASGEPGRQQPVGAIWAQDRSGVIGADDEMLWRVPADFRHFRAATRGGAVVMGRTTWDSLGGALDGRANVVLTRRSHWTAPGALVAGDLREALAAAHDAVGSLGPDPREDGYRSLPRVWVIGGGTVYKQALESDLVDELLITLVDLDAGAQAAAAGIAPQRLVHAPALAPSRWIPGGPRSDPRGQWRPVSGDASWRVDHWRRTRS
ncbi:dihydrofolate reductase [Actinomyces sp. 594]|uniref:dihydrofolate reductase n=1 Tax=Actinomyces sp. 594 TaxID=2057793 RepID=UPI001C5747B1|nr:dihydrofolate reductase [Actinomyces sp. 594]MBW3069243.1 dihydrofolate reductase [Actinomyces sp. 594]